jgi:hypothetical protein
VIALRARPLDAVSEFTEQPLEVPLELGSGHSIYFIDAGSMKPQLASRPPSGAGKQE